MKSLICENKVKLGMDGSNIKISFTGKINEENVRTFINDIKNMLERKTESKSLTICISSSGGSVDIAIELFYFLKLLDCEIMTINTSYVNSAAIIIFAAGTERVSLPYSSFYVHSITKNLNGDFTADDLLRETIEIQATTDKVAGILADVSNKNKSYWKRLIKRGKLLTPQKAIDLGLVNRILKYE